jgi:hypothetical protein
VLAAVLIGITFLVLRSAAGTHNQDSIAQINQLRSAKAIRSSDLPAAHIGGYLRAGRGSDGVVDAAPGLEDPRCHTSRLGSYPGDRDVRISTG